MHRVILMIVLAVGLLAVVGAIAARLVNDNGSDIKNNSKGSRGAEPVAIEVVTATQGDLTRELSIAGNLEATARFSVAPDISGQLTTLLVDIGDAVHQGQIIARIEDATYQQAVAAAQADVSVALAREAEATSRVELTKREAERAEQLLERGVGSAADRDRRQAALTADQAAIEVATAELNAARAALRTAEIDLERTTITTSWDGDDATRLISARHQDPGARLSAGDPIVTVVAIQPLTAVIHVHEAAFSQVQLGQAATLAVDAYPDQLFAASVTRMAPQFDAATRQARIELSAPNEDGRLKPGMFARVQLELERLEDSIIIPVAALVSRNGQPTVYIVDQASQTAHKVNVSIALRGNLQVAVEGISAGTQVVTLGQHLLSDGAPITIPGSPTPASGGLQP